MASVDPYDPDRAYDELIQAMAVKDPTQIARVANDYAWVLTTYHYELLMRALDSLPPEAFAQFDMLRLVHPVASLLSRTHPHSLGSADGAEPVVLEGRRMNEHLAKQVIVRRLSGDVKASLEIAERLDERLGTFVSGGGHGWCPLALFRFQLAYTYLLDGQTGRALKSFSTALQLSQLMPGDHVRRDAAIRSAVVHALRGSRSRALSSLQLAQRQPESPAFFAAFNRTAENIVTALIDVDRMAPDAAQHVEALAFFDPIDELWPLIALVRARFELAQGRPMAAMEEVSLAFGSHAWKPDTLADDVRIACLTEAFLALGQVGVARTICDEGSGRLPLGRLARVRVLIHEGRLADAMRACRELISSRDIAPATRAEAMLLQAWVEFELDGEIDASVARTVAQIAHVGDQLRLFTTVPESLIGAVIRAIPESEASVLTRILHGLRHAAPRRRRPRLTASELKVLAELPTAAKTAEIAKRLFVTQNTVKTQLASIYRKLGVSSRSDAVAAAVRLGLLDPPTGSATELRPGVHPAAIEHAAGGERRVRPRGTRYENPAGSTPDRLRTGSLS